MEDDTYRFGDFSMTSREQRLFRNGKSVLLPPKAFDAVRPAVTAVPGKSQSQYRCASRAFDCNQSR
jgi:hypothetical protein